MREPDPIDRRRFMTASVIAGAGALLWPDIPLYIFGDPPHPRPGHPTYERDVLVAQHQASSPRFWELWFRRMDAGTAASPPPLEGYHTTCETVLQLTQWIRDTRRWVLHGPPEPSWRPPRVAPAETSEGAWQAAIDDLIAANDELVSTLRRIPLERLLEPLERRPGLKDGDQGCCLDLLRVVHKYKWVIFFDMRALTEGRPPNCTFLKMVARPAS